LIVNGPHTHAAEAGCNSTAVLPADEDKTCTAERHGTLTAYHVYHCRCPLSCSRATRHDKNYRARVLHSGPQLVDVTGSRRRLQALAALGYSAREIGDQAGLHGNRVKQILRMQNRVHIDTAEAIRAAYAVLADRQPTGRYALKVRRWAAAQGWLPPIWWDDETIDVVGYSPNISMRGEGDFYTDPVAVDRYLSGDHTVRLTRAEKHEAYQRLRAAGHSVTAAAARLRLSGSTARDYEAAIVAVDTHTASDGTGKAGAA